MSAAVTRAAQSFSGTGWTTERLDALPGLLQGRLSARQVSVALGGGLSRSAVIGKARRLGLSLMPRKTAVPRQRSRPFFFRKPGATPATPAPPKAPVLPAAPPPPVDPLMVTLEQLEPRHCRFPIGDPQEDGFGFCGHPRFGDRVYCAYHCRLAYQPIQRRVRLNEATAAKADAA